MNYSARHKKIMRKALCLAEKGRYGVGANPMVGAILVKGGRIVGQGYHQKFGGKHAETLAIEDAGKKAKGADLYVTLEPCATHGKTPPCTEAIIEAGIRKVFCAVHDPTKKNGGKAKKILKKCKIPVCYGLLKDEAVYLNEPFFLFHHKKTQRPFVTLKLAQSLDGKIATYKGESRWITSSRSRQMAHNLRAESEAVAVGAQTCETDNPRLTVRGVKAGKTTRFRVVFVGKKVLPKNLKIFENVKNYRTLVLATSNINQWRKRFRNVKHVEVIHLTARTRKGQIRHALKELAKKGITKLMVEGGGDLAWSFLQAECLDRIVFFVAKKIIGGKDAADSVGGKGVSKIKSAIRIVNESVYDLGDDLLIVGKLR